MLSLDEIGRLWMQLLRPEFVLCGIGMAFCAYRGWIASKETK